MLIKIDPDRFPHVSEAQLRYIRHVCRDHRDSFVLPVEFPLNVGPVLTNLYGPEMGDDVVPNMSPYGPPWFTFDGEEAVDVRDPLTDDDVRLGNGGAVSFAEPGHHWETRFVRLPPRASYKVVIIAEVEPGDDRRPTLQSVLRGPMQPAIPGSRHLEGDELHESMKFWRDHALCCPESMQARWFTKARNELQRLLQEGVPIEKG